MKGKNLVKTPGELYAPTAGGVVVSADGVMENIVEILKEQGEQDIATVLEHEVRIEHNEQDIAQLQEQLGDYTIVESSEAEIEQLIEDDEADPNTLYLIPEEEEE